MEERPICPKCRDNEHLIWLEKKCENELKDLIIKGMKGMAYKIKTNKIEYLENNEWIESKYYIQPDDIMGCKCGYWGNYQDFLKNDNYNIQDLNNKITVTFETIEGANFNIDCNENDFFFHNRIQIL